MNKNNKLDAEHINRLKKLCETRRAAVYNLKANYDGIDFKNSDNCSLYRLGDGWIYRIKDNLNGGRLPYHLQKEAETYPNFRSGPNPVLYSSRRARYPYLKDETYNILRYYGKLPTTADIHDIMYEVRRLREFERLAKIEREFAGI